MISDVVASPIPALAQASISTSANISSPDPTSTHVGDTPPPRTSPSPVVTVNGVIQVAAAAPSIVQPYSVVVNHAAESARSDEGQPGSLQPSSVATTAYHGYQPIVLCKYPACGENVFAAPPGHRNPKFCPQCTHRLQ